MRIVAGEVIVSSPGRNFLTLKLVTDDGVVGYGDATVNGRERAVEGYLQHLIPLLIGRDATRIEDTWQYLYRVAYWRRGPITMASISAVDQALWDIAGKALGVPVHRLLGGRSRDYLMTYPHCTGMTVDEVVAEAAAKLEQGYRAIRVQAAVPGLATTYGVHAHVEGEEAGAYEPASGALPDEEVWDTKLYLDFVPKLVKTVRDELGYGFELLHDSHHRLTPIEAGWLGKQLEPYRMFWLEDTTPAEDQAAFRLIRQHTTTPLAVGEVFNSWFDYQALVTERLIDFVRTPVTHGGGITHLRQLMGVADFYGVRSGFHGPSDISPVGMAANCQLGWTIHNFGVQEYMGYPEQVSEVFTTFPVVENGVVVLDDDTPGLGVEIDEDAAKRFPFDPKYLPVNRKVDGTLHDW